MTSGTVFKPSVPRQIQTSGSIDDIKTPEPTEVDRKASDQNGTSGQTRKPLGTVIGPEGEEEVERLPDRKRAG